MTTNDGGPAFPRPYSATDEVPIPGQQGMSLRDWFAGQALASMAHPEATELAKASAVYAWEVSDAMLAEKAERKTDSP